MNVGSAELMNAGVVRVFPKLVPLESGALRLK